MSSLCEWMNKAVTSVRSLQDVSCRHDLLLVHCARDVGQCGSLQRLHCFLRKLGKGHDNCTTCRTSHYVQQLCFGRWAHARIVNALAPIVCVPMQSMGVSIKVRARKRTWCDTRALVSRAQGCSNRPQQPCRRRPTRKSAQFSRFATSVPCHSSYRATQETQSLEEVHRKQCHRPLV